MRAVIFDWGGTLTPWTTMDHLAAWRAYADVVHPDDPGAAAALAQAALAADDELWVRVKEHHRAFTLYDVLDRAGAPADPAALDAFRSYWDPATRTDPQAAPMLQALKARNLRTGVLSSTSWPGHWHEDILRRDNVLHHFDGWVWSSDLQHTKPHPEAFEAAMAAIGVTNPAECIYVGDRPYDDIHGAKSIGMKAILIPHSPIPEHQLVPTDLAPDAILPSLADLPALIDPWL
ncbi:HAD family hydrolase [Actinokineospora bangkokensis]|uniref:HAD family hydrolase n=1 Tax=Actinokineospora bangkokensis TaxID=1193682 RepID=A0A1Q9LEZ3_9PSEU|nr:HAD-IA family hydrolase [Actinokineospora bangkokensis]OLR90585.1 HAD family hydrolase [Actinokineospora bangkokensis]